MHEDSDWGTGSSEDERVRDDRRARPEGRAWRSASARCAARAKQPPPAERRRRRAREARLATEGADFPTATARVARTCVRVRCPSWRASRRRGLGGDGVGPETGGLPRRARGGSADAQAPAAGGCRFPPAGATLLSLLGAFRARAVARVAPSRRAARRASAREQRVLAGRGEGETRWWTRSQRFAAVPAGRRTRTARRRARRAVPGAGGGAGVFVGEEL